MAIVDNSTLKSYFNSGARPNNSQFIDLIDSLAVQGASNAFQEHVLSLSEVGGDWVATINHGIGSKQVFTFTIANNTMVLPAVTEMTTTSFKVTFDIDYTGNRLYVIASTNLVNPSTGMTVVGLNYTTPGSALSVTHNIANIDYFAFARDTTTKKVHMPASLENVEANTCDVIFDSAISGNLYLIGTGAGVVSYHKDGTLLSNTQIDMKTLGSTVGLYPAVNTVVTDFSVRVDSQVGGPVPSGSSATVSIGSDAPDFSNIFAPTDLELFSLNEVYQPARAAGKTVTHSSDIKVNVRNTASSVSSQKAEFVLFGYET